MSENLNEVYSKLWDEYKTIPKEDIEKRKAHMTKINEVGKSIGKKEYTVKQESSSSGGFKPKFIPRTTEDKVNDAEAFLKLLEDKKILKDVEPNQLAICLVNVFNSKSS